MSPLANVKYPRVLALTLFAFASPTVLAQSDSIPAAWEGVWELDTSVRLCGETDELYGEIESLTLCTGEAIYGDGGSGDCSATISDTSVDWTCSVKQAVAEGCSMDVTIHLVATRNGDSFESVRTQSTVFTGNCSPEYQDSCLDFVSTATRTAEDPQCTEVSATPTSWSSVKSLFR